MSRALRSATIVFALLSAPAGVSAGNVLYRPAPSVQTPVHVVPPQIRPVRPLPRPPVPVPFGGFGYPQTVVIQPIVVQPAVPRPIRPLSFSPVDPQIVLSRTASGRVVATVPGAVVVPMPASAAVRPYAPPEFHVIGAPSTRHMRGPVKLSHGTTAPEGVQRGPRVIWLKEPEGGRGPLKASD